MTHVSGLVDALLFANSSDDGLLEHFFLLFLPALEKALSGDARLSAGSLFGRCPEGVKTFRILAKGTVFSLQAQGHNASLLQLHLLLQIFGQILQMLVFSDGGLRQFFVPELDDLFSFLQLTLIFLSVLANYFFPPRQVSFCLFAALKKTVRFIALGLLLFQLEELLSALEGVSLFLERCLLGKCKAVLAYLVEVEHVYVMRQFLLELLAYLSSLLLVRNFGSRNELLEEGLVAKRRQIHPSTNFIYIR